MPCHPRAAMNPVGHRTATPSLRCHPRTIRPATASAKVSGPYTSRHLTNDPRLEVHPYSLWTAGNSPTLPLLGAQVSPLSPPLEHRLVAVLAKATKAEKPYRLSLASASTPLHARLLPHRADLATTKPFHITNADRSCSPSASAPLHQSRCSST
ncbi:hypothetical protein E2562_009574 [Oryza meyeriana var. granulata]|uniref:Uncharacterized protein n=1 Tax=Oryza meyeriana var. granulata TaxID=110450 RepID=A0A6G1F650_9ORYZ|nr:hypothetical protein E2562_009574 [Oryza meyeriana var. granulata]